MADKLNEDVVKALPIPEKGNKRWYFAGATLQGTKVPRGFGVRVTAAGIRSFIMNYRIKGKEYRYTIGTYPDWSVLRAVKEARELRQRIDRGDNPLDDRIPPAKTQTVADVIDNFVEKYVRDPERGLRTADSYENTFERLVKPAIGKIGIYDLRRSHVATMQDRIAKERGPVMADRARQNLRKALSWYAERDDAFNLNAAIVRVDPRANAAERARDRVLNDEEIRLIWPVLSKAGTFGNLVKTLLLTGQRRDEIASMNVKEIKDGIFTVPGNRYKTKRPNATPLSTAALAVIAEQKKASDCDYIFASSAKTPFSAFGKNKKALDKAVLAAMRKENAKAEPLPNWTLHDLRRSARTLMSRAGVPDRVGEQVLGHVIPGVENVYNRHDYILEKRDALEKLAAQIDRILNPLPANVTEINKKRGRA